MKVNINGLAKARIKFEPLPPPPPPPPGTPPPPPPPIGPTPPPVPKPYDDNDDEMGAGNEPDNKPRITEIEPENVEELKEKWKREIEKVRKAGNLPPEMQKSLDKAHAKKVDWKGSLQRFVHGLSQRREYFMPNKRFLSRGDILWGSKRVKEGFDAITLIVDTSGSISEKELEVFINEAYAIIEKFNPKKTYVLFFDTTVKEPITVVERGDNIKVAKAYGGGGTSFLEPFQWIQENLLGKISMGPVIFFTDGYPTVGGWPNREQFDIRTYESKVMWIIIHKDFPNTDPRIKIPFGVRNDLVYTEE